MTNEVKKSKHNINYIEVDYDDMTLKLGGGGICDSCSPLKEINNGFLIPVLNSVYCKECFSEWESRAIRYEEDAAYEKQKTDMFLLALNKV